MKTKCPCCGQEYDIGEEMLNSEVLCSVCKRKFIAEVSRISAEIPAKQLYIKQCTILFVFAFLVFFFLFLMVLAVDAFSVAPFSAAIFLLIDIALAYWFGKICFNNMPFNAFTTCQHCKCVCLCNHDDDSLLCQSCGKLFRIESTTYNKKSAKDIILSFLASALLAGLVVLIPFNLFRDNILKAWESISPPSPPEKTLEDTLWKGKKQLALRVIGDIVSRFNLKVAKLISITDDSAKVECFCESGGPIIVDFHLSFHYDGRRDYLHCQAEALKIDEKRIAELNSLRRKAEKLIPDAQCLRIHDPDSNVNGRRVAVAVYKKGDKEFERNIVIKSSGAVSLDHSSNKAEGR